MPGLLRKSMLYLGLVDDEEPMDDYDDQEPAPTRPTVMRYSATEPPPVSRRPAGGDPAGRRASAAGEPAPAPPVESPAYRITTLQPRTYNEARTIGEHFRSGVPVIMNLTEMDDGDAKRLVDFAAGLIFGLRGSIERVTNKVFLLSPSNVSVSAEDKARIAESGFFNQS